jgi:hypothetical protein
LKNLGRDYRVFSPPELNGRGGKVLPKAVVAQCFYNDRSAPIHPSTAETTILQLTIDLPNRFAATLQTYLQEHPEETLLSLLQAAIGLKQPPLPKDATKLLELAGVVTDAPVDAGDRAERIKAKALELK